MELGNRIIRQNRSLRTAIYRLFDALAIVYGLALTIRMFPFADSDATLICCFAAIGLFSILSEFTAMYRDWQGVTFRREIACALSTWTLTLLILVVLGRFSTYTTELAALPLTVWFLATPALSISGRVLIRSFRTLLIQRGMLGDGFVVVGVNPLGHQLVKNISNSPELGLKFMGFYDDRDESRTTSVPAEMNTRLGTIEQLVDHAKNGVISKIFIVLPMRAEDRINALLEELSDSTASVYLVPDFFVFRLLHSRWTDIQGLPAVSIFENPLYGVDGILKRSFDLVIASLLLTVLALPMLLIAVLIKLTSKGPVFFRQRRYGLDGKEIWVWKFRSMFVCEDGDEIKQAQDQDPRVTRLGSVLRRTSLDEIPQLFNVLQGTMSLVGPRPHATAHNEEYRRLISGYMLRHKVKPGITGLAQVSGWRGETETLEKMQGRIECDHRYIREWSLSFDLKILLKTLWVVWRDPAAK